MEIEYSNEVRGKVYAYRFDEWEMKLIARMLKPEIPRLEKKIERIRNHPENEGQATYADQIAELSREILAIKIIIETFSDGQTKATRRRK